MLRTAIISVLTLLIAGTCFGQAIHTGPATVVKITTDEDTYTGELLAGVDANYSLLDFKTGKVRKVDRATVKSVREDISEYEAIQTVGLANYLAWQVQRSTKAGRIQGQVAAVEEMVVYVNVGSAHGIEPGMQLQVLRLGEAVTDPATTAIIGYKQTDVGVVQVIDVQEQLAKAEFLEQPQEEPRVGDAVRLPSEKNATGILPLVNAYNWETVYSRRLAEELTTGLVQRGIRVVERRLLARVADELKLQTTSWFDPAAAKEIGKLVGAEAIVIGTVTPKKQYAEAQIRLVNVETGEILAAVTHRLRNEDMTPVAPFSTTLPTAITSVDIFAGIWVVEYGIKIKGRMVKRGRQYVVDKHGDVTLGRENGKLVLRGGVAFLDIGDGRLETWRLNGSVLQVEQFNPASRYPQPTALGTGQLRMDMGNDFAKVMEEIEGTWVARYTNGVVRKYTFQLDGTVHASEPKKKYRGKLSLKNGNLLLDFGDSQLDRVEVHGDRLLINHYNPRSQFPHAILLFGKASRE